MCEECGFCLENDKGEVTCDKKFHVFDRQKTSDYRFYTEDCSMHNFCSTNPCQANNFNGQCKQLFGSWNCDCKDKYYGLTCSKQNDDISRTDYASDISVMYAPISRPFEKSIFLVFIGNKGKNLEVKLDYGMGFAVEQNETSSYLKVPSEACKEFGVASRKLCMFLEREEKSMFVFETIYPVNVKEEGKFVKESNEVRAREHTILLTITNNLSLPNFDIVQFKREYSKGVLYDIYSGNECVPEVELKKCSKTLENVYYTGPRLDKEIESIVRVDTSCNEPIFRKWQVWRVSKNFDERNPRIAETEPEIEAKTFTLEKFTMSPDVYMIKLTGIYRRLEREVSNFDICFHCIKLEPMEAVIFGGTTRSSFYENDLVLNATGSFDPNTPQHDQAHLRFAWWCEYSEAVCAMHNTSDITYTVKGPFRNSRTYMWHLVVYSINGDREPSSALQKIFMSGTLVTNLLILCRKNCGTAGYGSNTHEIIYFKVILDVKPEDIERAEFVWSVEHNGNPDDITTMQKPGTPSRILIILENTLKSNSTYYFFVSDKNDNKSEASFMIKTSPDPIMGNCSTSPVEGIIADTNFTLSCDNFQSSQLDGFLKYEFYDKKPGEPGMGLFLGYSREAHIKNIHLLGGFITIRVVDSIYMFLQINISVSLSTKEFSEQEISDKIQKLHDLYKQGDNPGVLRGIAVLGELSVNSDLKEIIIAECLGLLEKITESDLNGIKLMTVVTLYFLQSVVDDDGLPSYNIKKAGYVMKHLGESFQKRMIDDSIRDSDFEIRVVREITENLIMIGELILKKHSDPDLDKKRPLLRAGEIKLLEYKDGYMSLVDTLQLLSQSVGHRLLPFEGRFVASTNLITVWAKVNFITTKVSDFTMRHDLEVKISKALAEEFNRIPGAVIIEVVSIHRNAFWWYQGLNSEIQTDIVCITVRKKYNTTTTIFSHLNNSIDIYLNLFPVDDIPVHGSAHKVELDDTEDVKDLAVSVHRIEPPKNAMVFLNFSEVPVNLKVLVLKDEIPDYQYIQERGVVITEENSQYFVEDTIIEQESFLYVGVLPDINASWHNSEFNYSFQVMTANCKTWRNFIFTDRGCKVVHDSTINRLHCACNHLSIFGGSGLVAPNLVNPITDLKLFLTLKDNPAVFIAIISVLVIYVLILIWAKYKDRKAEIQRSIVVLDDNYPGEKYGYLVCVYTGARIRSGTDANVGIRLYGKNKNSRAHILRSSDHSTLKRNNDDWFLLFTPLHLGEIKNIHVWHDNKGRHGDWFCEKILVYDLDTQEEYVFLIDQWLAPGEGEYLEVYMAPVSKKEALSRTKLMFENTIIGFREMHIWASIINRHPRSYVNRAHRLAVCVCAIMVSMLCSIMYYDLFENDEDEPYFYLDTRELKITIQSAIIATPVMFIILFLFRKHYKKNRLIDRTPQKSIRGKVDDTKKSFKSSNLNYNKDSIKKKISIEGSNQDTEGNAEKSMNIQMNKGKESEGLALITDTTNIEVISEEKTKNAGDDGKDIHVKDIGKHKNSYKVQSTVLNEDSGKKEIVEEKTAIVEDAGKVFNIYSKVIHRFIKTKPLNPVKVTFLKPSLSKPKNRKWIITAWIVSQSVIVICAFFIILYGLKMGKVRSELWLMTVAGTVGQDIFISTPLKILVTSFLIGFAYGKLYDEATFDLDIEDAMRKHLIGNKQYLLKLDKIRSDPMYRPLFRSEISEFRSERMRKVKWGMLLEYVIILLFYLSLLLLVTKAYSAKYYYKNEELERLLSVPSGKEKLGFKDAVDMETFTEYLVYNFMPKLYQVVWNDQVASDYDTTFGESGWFIDAAHRLIGVPRIRQLRVRKDACKVPNVMLQANISLLKCTATLSTEAEETQNFTYSWDDLNPDNNPLPSPWVYVRKQSSGGISLHGFSGKLYHSGGYIVNLGRSLKQTNFTLSELLDLKWLDVYTRFTTIELTLYNVNSNAFSLIEFMVENLPGGILIRQSQVLSLQVTKEVGIWAVIFIVFAIYFSFKNLYALNQKGFLNYLSQFWNFFEILILIVGLANFGIHVAHVLYSSHKIQEFQMAGKETFYSYTALIFYYHLIELMLSVLIVCCTIRQLRTFKLGRRIDNFYYTIALCARSIFSMTVVVILLLLLQSLVISFRLNQPFINSWGMFFTYRTGYRTIVRDAVYPDKRFSGFIYCFSVAFFTTVFIVLLSYYFRMVKNQSVLKSETFNYYSFLKEESKRYLSRKYFKKGKHPQVISRRLRGGMDRVIPGLSRKNEMLMVLRIKNFIKSHISHTMNVYYNNVENKGPFSENKFNYCFQENKNLMNKVLAPEKTPKECFQLRMLNLDYMLSSVISQIDYMLIDEM